MHLFRLFVVMLLSVFGTSMAFTVPMPASDITYFQTETTQFAQTDFIGFAARAPPLAATNVAITGNATVMQGGAFALHGQETVAALFGFYANYIATNTADDVVRVPTGPDYTPTAIGGRQYSSHALKRMDERGLTPSVVENTVDDAFLVGQGNRPNTLVYYDPTNSVQVVKNFTGDAATVIPGNAPKPGALAPLVD